MATFFSQDCPIHALRIQHPGAEVAEDASKYCISMVSFGIFMHNPNMIYDRQLRLPPPGKETFFLWGPRQTGKSSLLRATYPDSLYIDLLEPRTHRELSRRPEDLTERIRSS
ncbi:MAG: hypothetical protein KAI47_17790, partial [Deltaproteobacteria bacterium]|nr:hypothetical protein [Deltaproteobacteria bacterium]